MLASSAQEMYRDEQTRLDSPQDFMKTVERRKVVILPELGSKYTNKNNMSKSLDMKPSVKLHRRKRLAALDKNTILEKFVIPIETVQLARQIPLDSKYANCSGSSITRENCDDSYACESSSMMLLKPVR